MAETWFTFKCSNSIIMFQLHGFKPSFIINNFKEIYLTHRQNRVDLGVMEIKVREWEICALDLLW